MQRGTVPLKGKTYFTAYDEFWVYVKPYVSWIWGGCTLMALGGLLAVLDRRYRAKKTVEKTATSGAVPA